MKKVLCLLLCAMLILPGVSALGASYSNELSLPTHVRDLKTAYDEGEYGDEVFQLFSRDDYRRRGNLITIWVKDGQATGKIVGCDFYGGNPREMFASVYSLSAEQYQLLKDYVGQSDFDALPDYSKYSEDYEEMHCYTHITGDGLSYVQMINPGPYDEESQVYMGLLELLYECLHREYRDYYSRSNYMEYYLPYIYAYKDAYDRGEYGDEVYVLESRPIGRSGIGPSVTVSVKDGKAVVPVGGGKRVLSDEEYARLTGYIDLYDFDSLPWFTNLHVMDGVSYKYIHISKEGCRYISMANPDIEYPQFFDTSGPVYAGLVNLMYGLKDCGTYEEVDGSLWEDASPVVNETTDAVINDQITELEIRVDDNGCIHAELTPELLSGLGVKIIQRPDLDTVILYCGDEILLLDEGYSFATKITASDFLNDYELLAETLKSGAEGNWLNVIPLGTNVIENYIPLEAAVTAFGGKFAAGEYGVEITTGAAGEDLSTLYMNLLISRLLAD